jgi:hypothetical protein
VRERLVAVDAADVVVVLIVVVARGGVPLRV